MAFTPLSNDDAQTLALADAAIVQAKIAELGQRAIPPWLLPTNPYQDGKVPTGEAAFAAADNEHLLEVLAIRGPLHAIDGWGYLGRAINALVCGKPHAARHLAYYGELRGALSILAMSGIGIFNRRNVVFDAAGDRHTLANRDTHDMCWAALESWSMLEDSLDLIVRPLTIGTSSLLDGLADFFPGSKFSGTCAYIMESWGFDLKQGASDRDERNWSSYQLTSLQPIPTAPQEITEFLEMYWSLLRPDNFALERHLFRILLEAEMRSVGEVQLQDRIAAYSKLAPEVQALVSEDFLLRVEDPNDHQFLTYVADQATPARPFAMLCRAALILKLATGLAEERLRTAGVNPNVHLDDWWRQFGLENGLWAPAAAPENSVDLWGDIAVALEDLAAAPTDNRFDWTTVAGSAVTRVAELDRAGIWQLVR
ncbi:hypothetical protein [Aurantiacibacter hainanensis]|uniref:hypothetical protein n=1 Tax=Aurantiacibacter hainanensis TaxID=3076114 RepID=UPI0030C675E8